MRDLATLLGQVDASAVVGHVARIAEFERTPGSAGEKEAFAYIESTLYSCGLAPQRWSLPAYISIPLSAALSVAGESIPCTTHSMLPGADLEAELVYVPDTADIAGSSFAGKIIMTEGLAMAPVMKAAQTAKAAGMVFIAGARHWHEMIVSPVWGSPEPKDLDAYISIPAVTVSYADGERAKRLAHSSAPARMRTQVQAAWMDLPVITADIGPVHEGYLLLTGHVDSWHKGAMDNASGNAAALEIARILAGHAGLLRRGVRVVFWSGHSHGRYAGSAAFCDEFFQDVYDNAFLHVNADCLGATGATLLTQAACMAETRDIGRFAIQTVTGEELEGTRFTRSCDQSLWGTGTPSLFSSVSEQPPAAVEDAASKAFALMFGGSKSGGYGWWWHTEADTPDKLEAGFLARDTRIFLAAVYRACTEPVIPLGIKAAFAEFAAFARAYAEKGSAELDFTPLLRAIQHAETLLAPLDLAVISTDEANAFIVKFEQQLVPLVYVKGSLYGHDPALRQAPLPLLEDVHALVREQDPHRKNALKTLMKRRVNELVHRVKTLAALIADVQAPRCR